MRQGGATLNGSSWGTILGGVSECSTTIVLAQEHKLCTAEQTLQAESHLARRGWKATWSLATEGENGGASAGVAILVREYMDVGWHGEMQTEVYPARVVAQTIRMRGSGCMVVYAVYMVANQSFTSESNREILGA